MLGVVLLVSVALTWVLKTTEDEPRSPQVQSNRPPEPAEALSAISGDADILPTIWSIADAPLPDIPSYHGDVADAVPLVLNRAGLVGLRLGDELAVAIPQLGTRVITRTDRIKHHPGGIDTISGRGDDGTILITLGRKNTFAHISTRGGSFELVGSTTHGWLMPSENMDRNVDQTSPDFVLPEPRQLNEGA